MVKSLPDTAGVPRETDSISGLGRCSGVRNGNPPQYSCLENFTNRGTLGTTYHGVTESDMTELLSMQAHSYYLTLRNMNSV